MVMLGKAATATLVAFHVSKVAPTRQKTIPYPTVTTTKCALPAFLSNLFYSAHFTMELKTASSAGKHRHFNCKYVLHILT